MRSLSPVPLFSTFQQALFHQFKYSDQTKLSENVYIFPRSGHCLEYIFLDYEKKNNRKPKVCIPDFFCRGVLKSLEKYVDEYQYYSIDNLKSAIPGEKSYLDSDIIIVVDYFGYTQQTKGLYKVLRRLGKVLVVDRAHSFFRNGKANADYIFYSIHKTYGLPCGSILLLNKGLELDFSLYKKLITPRTLIMPIFKILAKKIFKIKSRYGYELFDQTADYLLQSRFLGKFNKAMLSLSLLSTENLLNDRLKNNLLNKEIVNILEPEAIFLGDDFLYYSVFEIKDHKKREELVQNLFKVGHWPVSWPDLRWGGNVESALRLKESLILLPNHQEIGFKFILKEMYSFVKSRMKLEHVNSIQWEKITQSFSEPSFIQDSFFMSQKRKWWLKQEDYILSWDDKPLAGLCVMRSFIASLLNMCPVRSNHSNTLLISFLMKFFLEHVKGIKILRSTFTLSYHPLRYLLKYYVLLSKGRSRSGILDISHNEADLLEKIGSKWRSKLKKSLEIDLTLEEDDNISDFIKAYNTFSQEKGFYGIPLKQLRFLLLNRKRSILLKAKGQDGRVLSRIALQTHGNTATYLVSINTNLGRELNANYFLLWKGIEKLREKQIQFLDLGGFSLEGNSIDDFKLGLNPQEYLTEGTFILL